MKRRDFVRAGSLVALGTMISPLSSCNSTAKDEEKDKDKGGEVSPTVFVLPELSFAFNALEPKLMSKQCKSTTGSTTLAM